MISRIYKQRHTSKQRRLNIASLLFFGFAICLFSGGYIAFRKVRLLRLGGVYEILLDSNGGVKFSKRTNSPLPYRIDSLIDYLFGIKQFRNELLNSMFESESNDVVPGKRLKIIIYEGCEGACLLAIDPETRSWTGNELLFKYGWNGKTVLKKMKPIGR